MVVSTEVDLLLLRLHELSPHVSTFFILESSHTFTGQPKPPIVEAALATAAFDPFRDRIRFTYVQGRTLARGESPFTQENELRATMTDILVAALPPPPVPVPVMLFSDVDELPSRDAVALVAACDFGKAVHLGMKEYMYSFAWGMGSDEAGLGSWRGSAVQWKKGRGDASLGEYYRHSKVTEKVLVDAGWHCSYAPFFLLSRLAGGMLTFCEFSWCFRTLDEFVVKAKGYSHTDRYRSPGLLRPAQIQKTICDGNDLAGMLPEGYTWREMAAKWHLLEERSAMHLPTYLTQHPDQFRFLLPRGCVREDAPRAGTT